MVRIASLKDHPVSRDSAVSTQSLVPLTGFCIGCENCFEKIVAYIGGNTHVISNSHEATTNCNRTDNSSHYFLRSMDTPESAGTTARH